MIRKKEYNNCHLCGEKHRLSYEHIPPRCCDNGNKIISFPIHFDNPEDTLESVQSKYKYIQHQQGFGGCVLCQKCNSYCGANYVPAFEDFYKQLFDQKNIVINDELIVQFVDIQPLAVIKEIYTIFLDINTYIPGYPLVKKAFEEYRKCILDKDSLNFGNLKLRIFLHVATGESKVIPFLEKFDTNENGVRFLSEFIFRNIGLLAVLEEQKKDDYLGCEITDFSNYLYAKKINVELKIPLLESHTKYPGDYRTMAKLDYDIKFGDMLLNKR